MGLIDAKGHQPAPCHCSLRAASLMAVARATLVLVALVSLSSNAAAAEQAEEFLRRLQDRGLNELALDYLERMQRSQLADEEFRRKIPYYRGVALIDHSRQTSDAAQRSRLLDEARDALETFAQSTPESVEGAEAQLQLGSMQLERGQQIVALAEKLPADGAYDAEREKQAGEAWNHFAGARETFKQASAIYSAELERLPPTATSEEDPEQGSRRQEYRSRVAQLRFLAAQTQFETARSHSPDDADYRRLHDSAARELANLYEEFGRGASSLVGLYARLYEGRCYQALGQDAMALGCYEDILGQPNVLPPFRKLIAGALHRKVEVLLAQEKYDQAIELCQACLKDANTDEERQPEWLAVRYRLAEARQKKGESLAAGSLDRRKLEAEARDAYRLVAATPGEFQADARLAMRSDARDNGSGESQKPNPTTFQAAYDLGKEALASHNAAKLAIPAAEQNNPAGVADLEKQMQRGKEDARRFFRLATTLVDDDTDLNLLNETRYFLCWLYWEAEDYYRAAVLGEFLARRFPDHPAAASAAKISMASFERLHNEAAASAGGRGDTEFEARRMAQIAEFIVRRWPGTDDAEAAFSVLVSYAIRNGRISEAEQLLADASPQSRPLLELQLGNAMWGRFLELSQSNGSDAADMVEVNRLKESAVKYLRRGVDEARRDRQVSDTAATAALYLVQAVLSDNDFLQAIALLEDRELGPLALIARHQPAAIRPPYQIEAYKAALRAYVLVTPPQEEKATQIMQSLDQALLASDRNDEAAEKLTHIYISLGVALQKQIESLRATGRTGEADRISAAFAEFLDRIAARQTDVNWPTQVWMAQTYYNMGTAQRAGPSAPPNKSFSTTQAALSPPTGQAKAYLTKARDAYRQLVETARQNAGVAPNETAFLAAQVQLGECQRALGAYDEALRTFSAVLREKENSLAVQCAAAYTYQERGQAGDARWLEHAIHGGHRLRSTGQNRIWGWLKVSQVAARAARSNEKYRDTFFEARWNMTRCRYLAAMKASGADRERDLAKAAQSIQSLAQHPNYSELGGEKWRRQFDNLLKQIQTAAGQNATGLGEYSAARPRNS